MNVETCKHNRTFAFVFITNVDNSIVTFLFTNRKLKYPPKNQNPTKFYLDVLWFYLCNKIHVHFKRTILCSACYKGSALPIIFIK